MKFHKLTVKNIVILFLIIIIFFYIAIFVFFFDLVNKITFNKILIGNFIVLILEKVRIFSSIFTESLNAFRVK